MRILAVLLPALAIAAGALLVAGRAGLLRGAAPPDLGAKDGRLKPPAETPNSVSSQADLYEGSGARYARIDPIRYRGDGAAALAGIGAIVAKMPGASIVQSRPDYLYARFESRWMRFVDDAEFVVEPEASVIHVRSASRLGRSDLGVNRARIEAIREAFAADRDR